MNQIHRRQPNTERLLGGTPLGVAVRLLITCFIVGLILTVLNVTPADILAWLSERARALSNLGFSTFREVAPILLLGAVVVIPIWLIVRVVRLLGR